MSVSRNTAYNLVGAITPVLIGLVMVPLYLRVIGADRYGVLAIAFLLLGYFGLFDLGLGRATAYRLSALNNAAPIERANVFRTALWINLAMGLVGGAVLYGAAGLFFASLFKVDASLRAEVMTSVPLLALTVPVATLMGTFIGTLQARNAFFLANKISILSTCLFQILPLAAAWLIGPALPLLLTAVLFARMVTIFVLWRNCEALLTRGLKARYDKSEAKLLLRFGGWVTLDSLFAPLLVVLDRFLIGAMIGAKAVTLYTLPSQLAQRISIIPGSLITALFPRLPTAGDAERAELATKATRVLLAVTTPPVLAAIFLIQPFFDLWVGPELGRPSAAVGVPILIGCWANVFAYVPHSMLTATGKPDTIAKLHVLQMPAYALLLWLGLEHFGLFGCAVVGAMRATADYLMLVWAARGSVKDLVSVTAMSLPMFVAAVAANLVGYDQPVWWLSLAALLAVTLAMNWQMLPVDLKAKALALIRHRIPGLKAAD